MEKFKALRWHRLSVIFKNIRLINSSKASPFEAVQVIVKGVTSSVEGSYDPESSPVFFHVKDKWYNFQLRKYGDIPVEIIFCRKDSEYVMKWQDALKEYMSNPSTGKNFDIVYPGEVEPSPRPSPMRRGRIEERSFDKRIFPSVDLNKLAELLNRCLPQNDICLKELLLKTIKNGYILNGSYHERTKGLAQGNPLSPLLANLYLDSFDEKIKKQDVKMIRYADDSEYSI